MDWGKEIPIGELRLVDLAFAYSFLLQLVKIAVIQNVALEVGRVRK